MNLNNLEVKNSEINQDICDFVIKQNHAMIYHSNEFIKLLASYLNCRTSWLSVFYQGELLAVMPYCICESNIGKVYNSLPFYGSNGGLLCSKDIQQEELIYKVAIEKFYSLAKNDKALSATIISNPSYGGHEFYEKWSCYTYKDERIGQIKHLPVNKTELLNTYDQPRPRNIRKALNSGVIVTRSNNDEDFDYLIKTHQENIKSIGGLYKSKRFFQQLRKNLSSDMYSLYTAKLQGETIAALLILNYGTTVEYFTPCISEQHRPTQALSLLIHYAMECAVDNNMEIWNWGGTWLTQGGVYDFKKRWGTKDYSYYYYTRVFDKSITCINREVLLEKFKNFYVLPFSALS